MTVRAGLRIIHDTIDFRVERRADDLQIAGHSSEAERRRVSRRFQLHDEVPQSLDDDPPRPIPGPVRVEVPAHVSPYSSVPSFAVLATAQGAPTFVDVRATLVRGPFELTSERIDPPPRGGRMFRRKGRVLHLRPKGTGEGVLRLQAGDVVRDIPLLATRAGETPSAS